MLTAVALLLFRVCVSESMRPRLMAAALLLLAGATVFAAVTEFEGKRIAAIRFDPVEQPLPKAEIARLLPFKTGDALSSASVRTAIENLYSTGRYSDIAVDITPAAENTVDVRIITQPEFFVGRVTVEGASEPPNEGELVNATKLTLGTDFSSGDLRQAVENILARLRANGFYSGTVTPDTSHQLAIEQINIDFKLDPGPRARFDGVIIQGHPERTEAAIIRSTRWRRFLLNGWRPLTEARLQSGIENVRAFYQKHDRLLANVSLSRLDYHEDTNRVTPTLSIEAGPIVKVEVQGARLSRGKLKQLLPIYQERSVDRSLLVEGRRNLVEYFQSQGYFDVDIDFEFLPVEKGEETILFNIDRNGRHKLVSLDIDGNRYFNDSTLRERMYLMPASLIRFRHGRYSQKYLERDVDAIQELYHSNGFQEAKVTPKVTDDYRGKTGDIAVALNVDEGPQWSVSSLKMLGIPEEDREYLLSVVHSSPGQPYSEFNVATDRDTILSYYFNNGFPDAAFDWTQSPGPAAHQVALVFTVTPGPRKFVRDVLVGGLETTDPTLVNGRINLRRGDPLSQAAIFDTQRRLYDLGIFAKVQTALQNPEGNETSKYVLYQLEEARRYSFNAGFGAEIARIGGGVTSFDAPAGATGFAPRISLGVSRLNFLGLGHTLSLQTRASTLQQRAVLSYYAPQFTGHENLSLTFSGLFDNSRDVRTFASHRVEGSIQLGQKLSRANTMQYRFTYRDVFVDPNSVKITPQLIPIFSQSVRVGVISTTFIQDRRDDPIDAHRGVYNTVDFGAAAGAFGSETSFARLLMKNATYYRLTRDLVLARSTTFGDIARLGGIPAIPLPERFFSGGSSSHRGFPDNQAGPRDTVTGFPLGGTALLLNSVELRFPLIGDNVGGVLFHDAGNVYSSLSDISFRVRQRDLNDFNYMVHAIGFGIRYRTPIGPIRIDLAVSPNSPRFFGFTGSRDELLTCSAPGSATPCQSITQRINIFQFHFSLGQAF
jgi:outer membrane protein insertion porin family